MTVSGFSVRLMHFVVTSRLLPWRVAPRALALTACAAGFLAGCGHAPQRHVTLDLVGESDPDSVARHRQRRAEVDATADEPLSKIVPPYYTSLALPVYPRGALTRDEPDYTVFVMATIDEHGRVTDVSPSVRHVTLPRPDADLFLAAIRETSRGWRFQPARRVDYAPDAHGEPRYLQSAPIPAVLEMKFIFGSDGGVK